MSNGPRDDEDRGIPSHDRRSKPAGPPSGTAARLCACSGVDCWTAFVESFRTPNVVEFAAPFDYIRGPKAFKTPLFDCIGQPKVFGRRKQSDEAANPTTFGVRTPSELLRRLSERRRKLPDSASHRARMMLVMFDNRPPVQHRHGCPIDRGAHHTGIVALVTFPSNSQGDTR
jgi:hypothetical protein